MGHLLSGKGLEWTDRAGNKLYKKVNPETGRAHFELVNAKGATVNEKDTLRIIKSLGYDLSRKTKKNAEGVASYEQTSKPGFFEKARGRLV